VKNITCRVGLSWTPLALLFSTLLTPGPAQGQASYKIQPIVTLGDAVADVKIRAKNGYFSLGTLNDSGQIAFIAANGDISNSEMLLQYADGKFIPIVVGSRDAPGGKWAKAEAFNYGSSPVSMNQLGNVVFGANATIGGTTAYGTFLWDFKAQKVTPVAFKGVPAVNNLTFEQGSTGLPMINNRGEIAFPAGVKSAAGGVHSGVFFLGGDGQLQAVALPDQELPGGEKVQDAYVNSLNDTGTVGFGTVKGGNLGNGAYLWEQGTITQVAAIGMDAPGGTIGAVGGAFVNNQNQNVVLDLSLQGNVQNDGLYLYANGSLTPLVVPGQEMPGGGKLAHLGAGAQNNTGQSAFIGWLQDGTRSAYLLQLDGKLSLILNTGATTELGKITNIGSPSTGICLNNKGQVALAVKIAGGPDTIVLLTPTAP
jgi:hypothetical protein